MRERPAPVVVDAAERAADSLRDRLIGLDAEGCARDGEGQVAAHPDSGRLRAWWIACIARAGRHLEAEALIADMLARRPDDVWAEFARLAAWTGESEPFHPEMLTGSAELLARLPARHDALVLRTWALLLARRHDDLLAFAAAEPDAPASARVVGLFSAARGDPTRLPEALAVAHAVSPDDPEFVAVAHAAALSLAQLARPVEALAWAEAGLERAPDAPALLRWRWALRTRQPGADAAAREAVLEDIEAALARGGARPAVLLAAAESLRERGEAGRAAPIEARLLAEFADAPEAEAVLFQRLTPERREAGAPPAFDPEAQALRLTMLDAYLARPRHHDPYRREMVARWRLEAVLSDPHAGAGAILEAVDVALKHWRAQIDLHFVAARAVVERTSDLARAEELALAGVAAVEAFAAGWSGAGADVELTRRAYLSALLAVLGDLYLRTDRLEAADEALARASRLTLSPFAELQLSLAELARRRGDLAGAEEVLAAGVGWPGEQGERCRRALEASYRQRTGSLRGLEEHLRRLAAEETARRRREILAGYRGDAEAAPDFALRHVDGRVVTLASLRGKIAVLHFWFNTCGGCLIELPEFAAFVAEHARDPDVAVVSLHSGGVAGKVAAWMRERGFDFDVLMAGDYDERARVRVFPTTWFLDQEGRLRFVAEFGEARHLREEFAWRLEELRARGRAPGGAVAG